MWFYTPTSSIREFQFHVFANTYYCVSFRLDILVGVQWSSAVILICISLNWLMIFKLSIFSFAYWLLGFSPLWNTYLDFELNVLFISSLSLFFKFWIWVIVSYLNYKYFLLGLPFYSWCFRSQTQVTNFNIVQLANYFLYGKHFCVLFLISASTHVTRTFCFF